MGHRMRLRYVTAAFFAFLAFVGTAAVTLIAA
jgi:hypothetical protein